MQNMQKCLPSKDALFTHYNSHSGEKTYRCPDKNCSGLFASYFSLRVHIRKLHPEQLKVKHNRNGEEEIPRLCSKCPKFFTSVKHVEKHEVDTHSRDGRLQCDVCSKIFTRTSNLDRHKEHVHGIGAEVAACTVCGKTPKDMKRHLLTHDQTQLVQCDFCQKVFKAKRYLKAHLKTCNKNK